MFVHNGTIFESAVLSPYLYVQEGANDGELVHEAKPHRNTYIHDEEKMRLQYIDHSML